MPSDGGIRTRIFATSRMFRADLRGTSGGANGLAVADALCLATADAWKLDGAWGAFLSDGVEAAGSRLVGNGPWLSLDGGAVFANRAAVNAAIASGSITNETGLGNVPFVFWTGTQTGGAPSTAHCAGWTTSASATTGTYGSASGTSFIWAQTNDTCDSLHRVLCLERSLSTRDGGVRRSPEPQGPKRRVFVTESLYPGDLKTAGAAASGPLGGDALCQQIATARTLGGAWKALLSAAGTRGTDRLTSDGPWVAFDGGVVFVNRPAFLLGVASGVMNTESGAKLNQGLYFWAGASSTGQGASDCLGWTSSDAGTSGTGGSASGTAVDIEALVDACHKPHRLLCVED